jgi:hypothetical protein
MRKSRRANSAKLEFKQSMSPIVDLPRWCTDIISAPPPSGDGFHNWMFRAARALWVCGRNENEIRAILENAATTCGRCVPDREIADAIKNSRRSASQSESFRPRPWPCVNLEQREAIIASGSGLVDLWETSPVLFTDNSPHTEQIIDVLFPANPLLCCAVTEEIARTATRDKWRGHMSELQLIVPSPMSMATGHNQAGEVSHRCLDNTGERRFLVVEFDKGTKDEHAALLLHLAERAPLALAVFSGSKSLHGWFYCTGVAEQKVSRFFRYAVSLGADRATWARCQLVRIPDGTRNNGNRQTVYFFNPETIR